MSCKAMVAAMLFAVLAVPQARAEDAGEGKIVLGLGAMPGTEFNFYELKFRTPDGSRNDYVSYHQNTLFRTDRRDFDDASENGAVKILTMPAGNWEIYTVLIKDLWDTNLSPKEAFSIPFTVKAGETIYIGDFKAVGHPNYSMSYRPVGVVFAVGDRSDRDIPIAQKKDAKIGAVTVAIPDVAAARTPLFVPEKASPTPTDKPI